MHIQEYVLRLTNTSVCRWQTVNQYTMQFLSLMCIIWRKTRSFFSHVFLALWHDWQCVCPFFTTLWCGTATQGACNSMNIICHTLATLDSWKKSWKYARTQIDTDSVSWWEQKCGKANSYAGRNWKGEKIPSSMEKQLFLWCDISHADISWII